MLKFKNLEYKKPVLLIENKCQKIYIEKTFFKELESDQYFVRLYAKNCRGDFVCQGYIYFAVDFFEKSSAFIGVYIKSEFRSHGLSSLLISIWIQLCFENGIYNLETISNQRKPFVLYLLKCYSFELKELDKYLNSNNKIYICQNSEDVDYNNKYLLFENSDQKSDFLKSAIAIEDKYKILDKLPPKFVILDKIILKNPYFLQSETTAYNCSLSKICQCGMVKS